jgi:hypothetical protein
MWIILVSKDLIDKRILKISNILGIETTELYLSKQGKKFYTTSSL